MFNSKSFLLWVSLNNITGLISVQRSLEILEALHVTEWVLYDKDDVGIFESDTNNTEQLNVTTLHKRLQHCIHTNYTYIYTYIIEHLDMHITGRGDNLWSGNPL